MDAHVNDRYYVHSSSCEHTDIAKLDGYAERPNKRTKATRTPLLHLNAFLRHLYFLVYLASFYYEFHLIHIYERMNALRTLGWHLPFVSCVCWLSCWAAPMLRPMIFQCIDPKGTDWRWPQKSNCHYCPFFPRRLSEKWSTIKNRIIFRLKIDVLVIRCGRSM